MVYIIRMGGTRFYKIGQTSRYSIDLRIQQLQTSCPNKLLLIETIEGGKDIERALQLEVWKHKTDGGKDWFKLNDQDVEYLLTHVEKYKIDDINQEQAWLEKARRAISLIHVPYRPRVSR